MDLGFDFSLISIFFLAAMVASAAYDIATYRIPNSIVVALVAVFLIKAGFAGSAVDWSSHLLSGTLLFAAGIIFYSLGQMGAGDVKLLGAVALWSGLGQLVPLIFWTSVSGMLLLVVLVVLRRVAAKLRENVTVEPDGSLLRILRSGEGAPYGVAICLGAFATFKDFPSWLWMR